MTTDWLDGAKTFPSRASIQERRIERWCFQITSHHIHNVHVFLSSSFDPFQHHNQLVRPASQPLLCLFGLDEQLALILCCLLRATKRKTWMKLSPNTRTPGQHDVPMTGRDGESLFLHPELASSIYMANLSANSQHHSFPSCSTQLIDLFSCQRRRQYNWMSDNWNGCTRKRGHIQHRTASHLVSLSSS